MTASQLKNLGETLKRKKKEHELTGKNLKNEWLKLFMSATGDQRIKLFESAQEHLVELNRQSVKYNHSPKPTTTKEMKSLNVCLYNDVHKSGSRVNENEIKDFIISNWGRWLASQNKYIDVDDISRNEIKSVDPQLYEKITKLSSEVRDSIFQTDSQKKQLQRKYNDNDLKKAYKTVNHCNKYGAETATP